VVAPATWASGCGLIPKELSELAKDHHVPKVHQLQDLGARLASRSTRLQNQGVRLSWLTIREHVESDAAPSWDNAVNLRAPHNVAKLVQGKKKGQGTHIISPSV